jgi:glycosyltransferase XagB
VLEADHAETIAAANACAWPAHVEVIVVPAGHPRTNPKALNYALTFARGAFVTVYDAEDAPAPNRLRAALDAFAAGGEDLGCVQALLLIDNSRASWLSAQFAAEYAIQFCEMLPLVARLGRPLLLGGTSNHFRTHALTGRAAGIRSTSPRTPTSATASRAMAGNARRSRRRPMRSAGTSVAMAAPAHTLD